MQLSPAEKYPIVRQLDNINDTATYYIKAVIKNAYTGTTLATVDLADKGSQYFSALWAVPNDVNGNGTYITITTFVYTDSGYTIPSATYSTDSVTAVIQLRPIFPSGMGGGGGTDYGRIGRMLDERKTDIPALDTEKLKQDIISVILDELKTIPRSYPSVEIPKVDLDGAVKRIHDRLDGMEKSNASLHEQAGQRMDELTTRHTILEHSMGDSMESMKKEVPEIKKMIDSSLSEHAKKMDEIHASMKEMTEDSIDAAKVATQPIRFEIPRRQKEWQPDERVSKLLS